MAGVKLLHSGRWMTTSRLTKKGRFPPVGILSSDRLFLGYSVEKLRVALYFMTYYALSAFDVSQPHLSALSLLLGFSGAIAAHWFMSTMD